MSYYNAVETYNLAAAQSDVPNSLTSSRAPRPISSQKLINSLASTSAQAGAGGMITFSIPTGAGANAYLVNNSMYLRCTIKGTAAIQAGADVKFNGPSFSATSIINRLTVSIAGTQVCSYNQYNVISDLLLLHTTNRNFIKDDCAILMYTDSVIFTAGAAVDSAGNQVDVCIPIICPLFNGHQSLPLFLLNSPITIQIDLNPASSALYSAVGASNPNLSYNVVNAHLVYETLTMSPEYCMSIRAEMQKGQLYQMNLSSDFLCMSTAVTQTLNYLIGCNLSSVKALLFTEIAQTPNINTILAFVNNSISNLRVYADGRLINNMPTLSSASQLYAELNRCLGNLWDHSVTTYCGNVDTAGGTIRGLYSTLYFCGGVSLNRTNDAGLSMTGQACQNLNILLEHNAGYTTTNNVYMVVIYDQVLTIDATGNVQLVK